MQLLYENIEPCELWCTTPSNLVSEVNSSFEQEDDSFEQGS